MDKITQFNQGKFDFEHLFKSIATLDLNIRDIYTIIVFLDEELLKKAGRGYMGIPYLIYENPDKEQILYKLERYIGFLEGLNIIFRDPEKGLEQLSFDKYGNYLGIRTIVENKININKIIPLTL